MATISLQNAEYYVQELMQTTLGMSVWGSGYMLLQSQGEFQPTICHYDHKELACPIAPRQNKFEYGFLGKIEEND